MMYCISLLSSIGSCSDCDGKSGLAHVCEHSVLVHHMKKHKNSSLLTIGGKTDFHSCSITFSMPREHVAVEEQSMIDDIISGQYLTSSSLERAKNEVLDECANRFQYDQDMRDVISFVTDGVISSMPTGKSRDVQSITIDDAHRGHPFGCEGSLIYVEHDSEKIYQLVFMPANKRPVFRAEPKPETKLLLDDGDSLHVYLAMPTSTTYADIMRRTIVEFILKARMRNRNPKIKKVYHKHFFREFSHLIIVFESCEKLTEGLIRELLDVMSDSIITNRELAYAKRSVAALDTNDLVNESIGDIQCFLSHGSPSMHLLSYMQIVDLIHSISRDSISTYMQKLFSNIHIVKGKH